MGLNIEASANVLGDNHSHSFFFYNDEKYTLIPKEYFVKENTREYLSALYQIPDSIQVRFVEIPEYESVLVYSLEGSPADKQDAEGYQSYPVIYLLLSLLPKVKDYNRLIVHFADSNFSVALAQGDRLLLANTYELSDVMTASYYLFMTLKKFVINPELTKILVVGDMPSGFEEHMSKYFSGVKEISLK